MDITVNKSELNGEIIIPPSKSMSHRQIISGSLSKGISKISNIVYSEDINATIDAMESLNIRIKKEKDCVIVGHDSIEVKKNYINCNESGSTIRFLIPIAVAVSKNETIKFDGKEGLRKRPLQIYEDEFVKKGISWNCSNDNLPVEIKGELKSGIYKIRGDVSSQFITGLLYGLSLVEGKSKIEIIGDLKSKGYVDLTIKSMLDFGVKVINNNYKSFEIEKSEYKPCDVIVEGDYSQLAFYGLAGVLGKEITVKGFNDKEKSLQGDKEIIKMLKKFGVKIEEFKDGYKFYKSETKGIEVDVSDVPDLAPVLCCVGAISTGVTIIKGIERLKIKECDRGMAIVTELSKLGCNIKHKGSYIEIVGSKLIGNVTLNSYNDHRIAMALTILGSSIGNIKIKNIESINKSYPEFLNDFKKIKGDFKKSRYNIIIENQGE